ncbi:MAG: hypothetical protein IKU46_06480 [Peptococcaceae bacterium]|nr:hypothetical protein [Peptococcaceae bacterium]
MDAQARQIRKEILEAYRVGITDLQAKRRVAMEEERKHQAALQREALENRRLARQAARVERRNQLMIIFRKEM